MPERGVFTQDFREGLLRGDFDLVVHPGKIWRSKKSPETEVAANAATSRRARNLLLVREDRFPQKSSARRDDHPHFVAASQYQIWNRFWRSFAAQAARAEFRQTCAGTCPPACVSFWNQMSMD